MEVICCNLEYFSTPLQQCFQGHKKDCQFGVSPVNYSDDDCMKHDGICI